MEAANSEDANRDAQLPASGLNLVKSQPVWLPLIHHFMSKSGDSLERHVLVASKRILHVESWTWVFLSSPGAAVMTKTWARVLSILCGMWVLFRPPEGLARMTWALGPTSIPSSVVRTARDFRFTALSLRNGQDAEIHGLASFGLLQGFCKVSSELSPFPANTSAVTWLLSFQEPVSFDGWYIHTGSGLPEFDPRVYILESSLDGKEWRRVAASWNDCGCFPRAPTTIFNRKNPINDDLTALRRNFAEHQHTALPHERGAEILFRFGTQNCMWYYYLIVVAKIFFAAAMIIAPVIAIFCTRQDLPFKCIALGSIISAIMSVTATIHAMDDENGPGLPAGPFSFSAMAHTIEAILLIFVFPGGTLFSEKKIVEQGLMWGILQTSVQIIQGTYSVSGPLVFTVGLILIITRERRRLKIKKAIRTDSLIFDRVWDVVRTAPEASNALDWLLQFSNEMPDASLQPVHLCASSQGPSVPDDSSPSLARCVGAFCFPLRAPSPDVEMGEGTVTPDHSGADGQAAQDSGSTSTGDMSTDQHCYMLTKNAPLLARTLIKGAHQRESCVLSLDQLYAQAVVLDPIFRAKTEQIALENNGHFFVSSLDPGSMPCLMAWRQIQEDPEALASVQWGGVKKLDCAVRKMAMCYSGRASQLRDLVRQRIVFDSLEHLRACVEAIFQDCDLEILRFRNRFDVSYDAHATAGYRDVVMILRLRTQATVVLGLAGHLVELQLALRQMAVHLHPQQHRRYLDFKVSMLSQGVRVRHHTHSSSEVWPMRTATTTPRTTTATPDVAQVLWDGAGVVDAAAVLTDGPTVHMTAELQSVIDAEHRSARGEDEAALQSSVAERVFEVVRWRCSFSGSMLKIKMDQANTDFQQADASILLFARPLWAVSKGRVKIFLVCVAAYYIYQIYQVVVPTRLNLVNMTPTARHVRLTVLETRQPQMQPAIGGLQLMHYGCKHGSPPWQSQHNSTFFASFPAPVLTNGWSLTTSHTQDRARDPVRFLVEISNPPAAYTKSLADCLVDNAWRTRSEVATLTPAQQRAQVVAQLQLRGTGWCTATLGSTQRTVMEAESQGVCQTSSRKPMTDKQLLALCAPPWQVADKEWHLVFARTYTHTHTHAQTHTHIHTLSLSLSLSHTHTHIHIHTHTHTHT